MQQHYMSVTESTETVKDVCKRKVSMRMFIATLCNNEKSEMILNVKQKEFGRINCSMVQLDSGILCS